MASTEAHKLSSKRSYWKKKAIQSIPKGDKLDSAIRNIQSAKTAKELKKATKELRSHKENKGAGKKSQSFVESNRMSSRRYYWKKKAENELVPGSQFNAIMRKIKAAKSDEPLKEVKEFFQLLKQERQGDYDLERSAKALERMTSLLRQAGAGQYSEDIEEEFWRRFNDAAGSPSLLERILEIYRSDGAASALRFMDIMGL